MKSEKKTFFALFLLIASAYINSLRVGFIWDDIAYITDNSLIRKFSNIPDIFTQPLSAYSKNFYRPLQNLSLAVDFFFYKFDYRGYHLTNIVLHFLVVILAYWFITLICGNKRLASVACALYAVCPLWVETVTYISGRADSLMAIFLLSAFIFFLRDKLIWMLVCFAGALLSKEAAIVFPLGLIWHTLVFEKKNRKRVLGIISTFCLIAIYIFIRSLIIPRGLLKATQGLIQQLLIFISAISEYILMLLAPLNQHMSHTVVLPTGIISKAMIIPYLLLLVYLAMFIYFLKKDKIRVFFMGWFFIFLIPYSGIVPINAHVSEHFIYFASIGLFANAAFFLQKLNPALLRNILIIGYVTFLSVSTMRYNLVWQDPIKLYERIIKFSPSSDMAYNNLGVAYTEKNQYKEAERMLKKAILLKPRYFEARLNLARMYYLQGDIERAAGLAQDVVVEDPENFLARDYLGTFYIKQGRLDEARKCFEKAVELNPRLISLRADLFLSYKISGDTQKADEELKIIGERDRFMLAKIYFQEANNSWLNQDAPSGLLLINKALEIDPSSGAYHNLKGCILKSQGDFQGALASYKLAMHFSPRNWEIYNNIANLFVATGNIKQAELLYQELIKYNKASPDVYFNLGLLYFKQNKLMEAQATLQKALALNPLHALAKEYLDKLNLPRI